MLNKVLKVISLSIVFSLLISSLVLNTTAITIDQFLLNAGFPESLVESMPIEQKTVIFENSYGKNIAYSGYSTQDFVFRNDNLVNVSSMNSAEIKSGSLAESDLTISVTGTYTFDFDENYNMVIDYYTVYPNFVWHRPVKVKNDTFTMRMYSGWEAIPQERNLRLHLLNSSGVSVQNVDLSPTQAFELGYAYKVPSTIGAAQALYSGYAYYNINRKVDNASGNISLHYTHDGSSLLNISYSMSVYGVQIAPTPDNDNLYTISDNYEVIGLLPS